MPARPPTRPAPRRGGILGGLRAVWRFYIKPAPPRRPSPRLIRTIETWGHIIAIAPICASFVGFALVVHGGAKDVTLWLFAVVLSILFSIAVYAWMYVRVWGIRHNASEMNQRLCPNCGYSLESLDDTGACPECGAGYTPDSLRDMWTSS